MWEVPRLSPRVEGQRRRRRTGCKQSMNFSGSQRATCRYRLFSESTEPLAGRLGVEGLTHSEGISYKPPCGEVEMCPQVGRMGPISEDGPGHYNLDWSEGPWGREAEAARTEVPSAPRSPDSERGKDEASEEHEGRTQTARREELAGDGKALSDIPALKPY